MNKKIRTKKGSASTSRDSENGSRSESENNHPPPQPIPTVIQRSKLDQAERRLVKEFNGLRHLNGVSEEVKELEDKFLDDLAMYKTFLEGVRDSRRRANRIDFEREVEKLTREKELLDENAEREAVRQLIAYFNRKKQKMLELREEFTDNHV